MEGMDESENICEPRKKGAAATALWRLTKKPGDQELSDRARVPRPSQILQVRATHLPPPLSSNPLYAVDLFSTLLCF